MKKKETIIDYVPQNKSLPYLIGALSIIAFVLGMMYSPLAMLPSAKKIPKLSERLETHLDRGVS